MPDNKDPNQSARSLPPGPMREPLAQAANLNNADICKRVDETANNLIRQACLKKQFEQTDGNCAGIDKECRKIEEPKIVPCLRLKWGDGPNDHLETDDTEVLCITVCNPYSNVTLEDFTVQLIVTDANGNAVANQADGTPSVMIKPSFMICFDDIPACNPSNPAQSCVSREVVLINRGAKPGKYRVFVIYCFHACFTELRAEAAFELDLVAS
jgi:hypothetical protein